MLRAITQVSLSLRSWLMVSDELGREKPRSSLVLRVSDSVFIMVREMMTLRGSP